MNKVLFAFWKHFGIWHFGKIIHYIVIYSFVFFPCLTYAASSPERREVVISIEKDPKFFKACVPCFEYIGVGAIPPDVIAKNNKSVRESASGS